MSTKQIVLSAIAVLVVTGIVFLIVRYQQPDNSLAKDILPELKVVNIQVLNLTGEQAEMAMNMVIDNPAPFGVKLDSLYYTLFIEDIEVMKTTYPDPIDIEGGDSATFSLPLTINYNKMESLLKRLEDEGRDSAVYKINSIVYTNSDLVPDGQIEIEVDKRLPLIRIPEINITDMRIEDLSFSGVTIVSVVTIENENDLAFGFKDMSYSLSLADNNPIEGEKREVVEIPAKGTTSFEIPVEIDLGEMGESLIDLIKDGGDLSYEFIMNADMIADAPVIGESKINMSASGNLRELKEVAKSQAKE